MPISERIKYGLIFLIVIAALLLLPLPASGASNEQSQEIGVIQTNLKQKSWDEIVSEQLKRKAEQERLQAEALEAARQTQIEAQQALIKPKPSIVPIRAVKRVTSAFNAYLVGSCVWFVSQKRAVGNWGNAREWLANARRDGFATGSVPKVGAIAWTSAGALGHVAYVVAVNGNQITVQDMNYAGRGVITTRLTSASEWVYIY